MLDIQLFRTNPDLIKKNLKKRKADDKIVLVDEIINKDKEWRRLLQEAEALKHERNVLTEQVNELKKQGKDITAAVKKVRDIPGKIKALEEETGKLKADITAALFKIPNLMHESVPVGKDDTENVMVRQWGTPEKKAFPAKSHVDLLTELDIGDTERAAKTSGARFYFLKRELVLLDMALLNFTLDLLYKKGFVLIEPPYMIKRAPYEGITDLADFEDVLYK
ncbi:serine--tRNA ligase, partial [Candidatus Woesearchaeota archaeon CG_4_10_14_0_8_um_filter_47_5]